MAARLGLGAMRQKTYPDPYGLGTWDLDRAGAVYFNVVNSAQNRGLIGHETPPSPIDVETYISHGLPWFELRNEEGCGDVPASEELAETKSIRQKVIEVGLAPDEAQA